MENSTIGAIGLFVLSHLLVFLVGFFIGDCSGKQTREQTILRNYKLKKRKKPLLEDVISLPQEEDNQENSSG